MFKYQGLFGFLLGEGVKECQDFDRLSLTEALLVSP